MKANDITVASYNIYHGGLADDLGQIAADLSDWTKDTSASCKGKGRMLKDITLKPNILIACINRMGRILIPGGVDTLESGDTVVVITASNRVIVDLNDIFAEE